MAFNKNGRLISAKTAAANKHKKLNIKLSLIAMLLGIFLLPRIAYLSAITPEKIIELTNSGRESQGLNVLTANQLLTKAAILKAENIIMADTFSHTIDDKKFSGWIKEAGYNYSYAGENLALDFVSSEGIINAWNNSPSHKKNLLSPYYQEIGVAAIAGNFQGQETIVVVEVFGAPAVNAIQSLTLNGDSDFARAGLTAPQADFLNLTRGSAENLLTHAVLKQKLPLPGSDKLILPAASNRPAQVNKFFVQDYYNGPLNGFIIIFIFFILLYLLIYLYYYYFFKVSRLASA